MSGTRWTAAAAMAAVFAASAGAASAADVTVAISGVKAGKGPLYVSLQTEAQFLQNAGSYGEVIAAPGVGDVKVTLKGVAPGEYSVSVWHDTNGNGVFDRAPDGRPLDGWSMNNAGSLRGQPVFSEVKFSVAAAGASLDLPMYYPE